MGELVMDAEEVNLYRGDCREVMAGMPDNSVDAIVTDPPYELGFMGKRWDRSGIAYDPEVWAQAFRVLKPGGHALVFGGTRTWHRVAVAIEDAGFEIRDSLAWLYGSGFPKSMDVSKAIDKELGAEREVIGQGRYANRRPNPGRQGTMFADDNYIRPAGDEVTAPGSADAKRWEGWGTALKPAFEPVVVARKPLVGTVAANVLAYGTGAINIDACRIEATPDDLALMEARSHPNGTKAGNKGGSIGMQWDKPEGFKANQAGRFPSNVLLDESQSAELDKQSGVLTSGLMKARTERQQRPGGTIYGADKPNIVAGDTYADSGGASRFFYVAKAGRDERPVVDGNQHSTVKPLTLIRYLVRLITPPGGTVLDMFAGSGTTGEAAILEGFDSILIELDEDGTHIPLIRQRLGKPLTPAMF